VLRNRERSSHDSRSHQGKAKRIYRHRPTGDHGPEAVGVGLDLVVDIGRLRDRVLVFKVGWAEVVERRVASTSVVEPLRCCRPPDPLPTDRAHNARAKTNTKNAMRRGTFRGGYWYVERMSAIRRSGSGRGSVNSGDCRCCRPDRLGPMALDEERHDAILGSGQGRVTLQYRCPSPGGLTFCEGVRSCRVSS
jgi:hypothetical protein